MHEKERNVSIDFSRASKAMLATPGGVLLCSFISANNKNSLIKARTAATPVINHVGLVMEVSNL